MHGCLVTVLSYYCAMHQIVPPTQAAHRMSSHLTEVDSAHPAQRRMWNGPNVAQLYNQFADHHAYHEVLEFHLEALGDLQGEAVLELGCGIGSSTRLLSDAVGVGTVHATDLSPQLISYSSKALATAANVSFQTGDAYSATSSHGKDSTLITAFNCIHLFNKLPHILITAFDTLPEQGRISFCTGLTVDATSLKTGKLFAPAIKAMRNSLREDNSDLAAPEPSHPPLRRAAGYVTLCRLAGFEVQAQSQTVLQPLAQVHDFLLLPGVLSDILRKEVRPEDQQRVAQIGIDVLAEKGCQTVERTWLHVIGTKTGSN